MGASSELFGLMREKEVSRMYEPTFTKKDAVSTGEQLAKKAIDEGNIGKHEFAATLVRLEAVITSAVRTMRDNLPNEKISINGVEFVPTNGGYTLNYEEDLIYCMLKADVDKRVELLKLAQNQEVFDASGNEGTKSR